MKKLSNTEAELKKSIAYKNNVYVNKKKMNIICYHFFNLFRLKVETRPKIF